MKHKLKDFVQKDIACDEAVVWAKGKTWQEIYSTCPRGDWLLWLFVRTNPDSIRERVLAAGLCANSVRHLMKDERSLAAVDAAIAFGRGEIELEQLKKVADAARAARAAVESAAWAEAAAAVAAREAAWAAVAAAVAAWEAAWEAAVAAAVAAWAEAAWADNQLETANIVRETLPIETWNVED